MPRLRVPAGRPRRLRGATAALPAPARTRDYRLTDADAARLRPTQWRRLVGWLGAPRSTVRPIAGALATLGIAGLLLSTTPGLFGQAATTVSTAAAPLVAPGVAGTSAARPTVTPASASRPARRRALARRGAAPATSQEPVLPRAAPGLAALPRTRPVGIAGSRSEPGRHRLPNATPGVAGSARTSPAAAALPAPTPPAAGVGTGPAAGAASAPSGFASNSGPRRWRPKAAATEPPQADAERGEVGYIRVNDIGPHAAGGGRGAPARAGHRAFGRQSRAAGRRRG